MAPEDGEWVEGDFQSGADGDGADEMVVHAPGTALVARPANRRVEMVRRRVRQLVSDPVVVAGAASAATVASGVALRMATRALTGTSQRRAQPVAPMVVFHQHIHVVHHIVHSVVHTPRQP